MALNHVVISWDWGREASLSKTPFVLEGQHETNRHVIDVVTACSTWSMAEIIQQSTWQAGRRWLRLVNDT
jgi:hypothetical protein